MQKRVLSLLAIVALFSLMLPSGTATYAETTPNRNYTPTTTNPQERVNVMVELQGEPTVVTYATTKSRASENQANRAAQAQLATLQQTQAVLSQQLTSLDATILYSVQRVYNGIAINVPAGRVAAVAKLPNVKAVHKLASQTVDNAYSVPLIGAPQLWAGMIDAGVELTGENISIGVIDTGIDYIHTDFGGSGLASDYAANDTTIITDSVSFPTMKVVGGYDFVGDAYNADSSDPLLYTPMPDPDPMDCNGHGSHVSGTAAGYGVLTDGSTYTGPYTTSLDPMMFRIGPGVAPQADLYALKVFGCTGSTNVTSSAIEWAVDPDGNGDFSDHLDVINMSLGSSSGSEYDESAIASNNAVLAGVIVVTSAGNSGNTYYITGAPGVASRAISTAGSVDSSSVLDAFIVNEPASLAGQHPASFSVEYDWANSPVVTGTLVYPPTQRTGCQPFDAGNTSIISGNIVLLDWTDNQCGSITRGANARAAGAIGFILVDNSVVFDLFISGDDVIPGVSTPKEIGDALKAALQTDTVNMTFDPALANVYAYIDESIVDTVYTSSSRGPRRGDNALKPDITAPGVTIFSAAVGTGDQGASFNGTSMASPHVAGSMALLRELHPDWSVEELKALAMNTARNDIRTLPQPTSDIFSPARSGAGRVDLPNAADDSVIVYNVDDPGYVSVSFGSVEVVNTTAMTKTVRITNKGTATVTETLSYVPVITIPGVVYELSEATVVLAAGQSQDVQVTMTADPALMEHTRDRTVDATQAGLPRHWISEATGYIALNPVEQVQQMKATLTGNNEIPTVNTTVKAWANVEYDANGNQVTYTIEPSAVITPTTAHFHLGSAGENGPVAVAIPVSGSYGPGNPISGTVTMDESQSAALQTGHVYINIHTAANPSGYIRGQVVPYYQDLRLPVYVTARPASDMHAEPNFFNFSGVMTNTGSLTMTGQDVQSPDGNVSLVTAYNLTYMSPNEANTVAISNNADLQYVGIATDDINTTGMFTETNLYFGVSTYGDWSTPAEVEFDIYIDIDEDGTDDFVVYNGRAAANTDVYVSIVVPLSGGSSSLENFINGVPASGANTVIFNNNVMAIPVAAGSIGLDEANPTFNYHIETSSRDATGVVDTTPILSFNAAQPTLNFTGAIPGTPAFADTDGSQINFEFNSSANDINNVSGMLLFHHYNTLGNRVEVIDLGVSAQNIIFLPLVLK